MKMLASIGGTMLGAIAGFFIGAVIIFTGGEGWWAFAALVGSIILGALIGWISEKSDD